MLWNLLVVPRFGLTEMQILQQASLADTAAWAASSTNLASFHSETSWMQQLHVCEIVDCRFESSKKWQKQVGWRKSELGKLGQALFVSSLLFAFIVTCAKISNHGMSHVKPLWSKLCVAAMGKKAEVRIVWDRAWRIKFVAKNPKVPGTATFKRWQQYSAATT